MVGKSAKVMAVMMGMGVSGLLPQAQAALVAHTEAFTQIQDGFKAEVVGTAAVSLLGGVAFAPDGDILSTQCSGSGTSLIRYDIQAGTTVVNGSNVFASSSNLGSGAGCGLLTHSNGGVYTNLFSGVSQLNPATGAVLAGPAGGPASALGISEDPLTGNIYYAASSGVIKALSPDLSTVVDNGFATAGGTDGIFWNPDGSRLYAALVGAQQVREFDRTGALINTFNIGHGPDGIAFALDGRILTNNTDGTISQILANGTVELFATGGFRGDLGHVGSDGAWYITQRGVRYADGTVNTSLNSIVRISKIGGGGFGGGGAVPEPISASLGLMGIAALGLSMQRRRSA